MAEDPQLKNLFEYTKFHIGVYISITSAILAGISFDHFNRCFFIPILAFVVAGMCGGAIGSSIPFYEKLKSDENQSNGFIDAKWIITYKLWIIIEHAAFWIGVVLFLLVLFFSENGSTQTSSPGITISGSRIDNAGSITITDNELRVDPPPAK